MNGSSGHQTATKVQEYDIPFPFEPYIPQQALMQSIYKTLDNKEIGIFSSPTGTGKSLSIICSSLHWLLSNQDRLQKEKEDEEQNEHKSNANKQSLNNISLNQTKSSTKTDSNIHEAATQEELPSWFNQHFADQKIAQENEKERAKREMLDKNNITNILNDLNQPKAKRARIITNKENTNNKDSLFIDDCEMDKNNKNTGRSIDDWEKMFENAVKLNKKSGNNGNDNDQDVEYRYPQIIYCSRTHSQLSQFVNEIKKTNFSKEYNLEIITLGSRKQLCIHPRISNYKSSNSMNDACLELQEKKSLKKSQQPRNQSSSNSNSNSSNKRSRKRSYSALNDNSNDLSDKSCGCPYLNDKLETYSIAATSKIHDIEQCHTLGVKLRTCPYYGIRKAVPRAHLIAIPYASLIHEGTRNSLGLKLENNVVIIDEAHNLIENINQIHSNVINVETLQYGTRQLNSYKSKYINRLKAKNIVKIDCILKLYQKFIQYLTQNIPTTQSTVDKNSTKTPTTKPQTTKTPAIKNRTTKKQNSKENNNNNQQNFEQTTIGTVVSVDDLTFQLGIAHINFYELVSFVKQRELVRKLYGFCESVISQEMKQNGTVKIVNTKKSSTNSSIKNKSKTKTKTKNNKQENTTEQENNSQVSLINENIANSVTHSPLSKFITFLESLTNVDCDAKLIVSKSTDKFKTNKNNIRFVMLNPSVYFNCIVKQARSVILLGGTMSPTSHFVQQLFSDVKNIKNINILDCDHVVSANNVCALTICKGPSNKQFNFTFKHRYNSEMIRDLGNSLINFAKIIYGGIVVFLPSFKYLQFVINYWKQYKNGAIYSSLSQRKVVLIEPQSASEVDWILEQYSNAIYPKIDENDDDNNDDDGKESQKHVQSTQNSSNWNAFRSKNDRYQRNGAILFCVVGAKMSEGINFKDDLARCVVMVGLPFPNPHNLELQQRMKYLNKVINNNAGKVYYQNLCMRAVNQSIGRAIRHRNDFGCIVLIDERYGTRKEIYQAIPRWIQRSLHHTKGFGQAISQIARFAQTMKHLKSQLTGVRS